MNFFSTRTYISFLLLTLTAVFFIQSCGGNDNIFSIDFSDAPPPYERSQAIRDTTLDDGTEIFVLEEGDENIAPLVANDRVQVRLTGRTEGGEVFETSFRANNPGGSFALPKLSPNPQSGGNPNSQLAILVQNVEGFRKGMVGMREGEKRIIEVPPSQGFVGQRSGVNRKDLRGDTLIFDVELVRIL